MLAAVFTVAALAKLTDREGSGRAIRELGVPGSPASVLAVVLPVVELATAAALLAGSPTLAGLLALGLLGIFTVAIAVNLARGRSPECHCFGQLHAAPVGPWTLVRNGVLVAAAVFVLSGDGHPSPAAWVGDLNAAQRLTLVGVAALVGLLGLLGWFVLHLVVQNGQMLLRLEALEGPAAAEEAVTTGLAVGSPAPAFSLPDLAGQAHTLESLLAPGHPLLLVFSDPGCRSCGDLVPELGRWQNDHSARLSVAVVSRGDAEANRRRIGGSGLAPVLLQVDREVAEAFQYAGTPSAVFVSPDGTLASRVVAGPEAIRTMVKRALGTGPVPVALRPPNGTGQAAANGGRPPQRIAPAPVVGQPAPTFALSDLEGSTVTLGDLGGSPTVVMFWNPGCGFCEQMLGTLKEWEAVRPPETPKIVVVSSGSVDANRSIALSSPVLSDTGAAMRAFGAYGTPMAVLLDGDGRIASPLVAGAQPVMALAQGRPPEPAHATVQRSE
jgi:peroxiredoxin